MKNIVKKFFKSLFGSKDYNTGFAIVNQPCFDKNGKFLGWFSRSMATAIFVFARNKDGVLHVLASERGKGAADFQGCWNCPCGYLDFNETTKQCAIRELEEETGIGVSEEIVRFISYEDDPVAANHQNVTFRFGVNITDHTIEQLSGFSHKGNEKDEVGEIKWIMIDDIDKYEWAFGHDEIIKKFYKELVSFK